MCICFPLCPHIPPLLSDRGKYTCSGHRVVLVDTSQTPLYMLAIAGSGSPGYSDGKHAQFDLPMALAVVSNELILVVDQYRNVVRSVARYKLYSGFDKSRQSIFLYLPYILFSSLAVVSVLVFVVRKWYLSKRHFPGYRQVPSDRKILASYLETSF